MRARLWGSAPEYGVFATERLLSQRGGDDGGCLPHSDPLEHFREALLCRYGVRLEDVLVNGRACSLLAPVHLSVVPANRAAPTIAARSRRYHVALPLSTVLYSRPAFHVYMRVERGPHVPRGALHYTQRRGERVAGVFWRARNAGQQPSSGDHRWAHVAAASGCCGGASQGTRRRIVHRSVRDAAVDVRWIADGSSTAANWSEEVGDADGTVAVDTAFGPPHGPRGDPPPNFFVRDGVRPRSASPHDGRRPSPPPRRTSSWSTACSDWDCDCRPDQCGRGAEEIFAHLCFYLLRRLRTACRVPNGVVILGGDASGRSYRPGTAGRLDGWTACCPCPCENVYVGRNGSVSPRPCDRRDAGPGCGSA